LSTFVAKLKAISIKKKIIPMIYVIKYNLRSPRSNTMSRENRIPRNNLIMRQNMSKIIIQILFGSKPSVFPKILKKKSN
jgi:hypothetical protein